MVVYYILPPTIDFPLSSMLVASSCLLLYLPVVTVTVLLPEFGKGHVFTPAAGPDTTTDAGPPTTTTATTQQHNTQHHNGEPISKSAVIIKASVFI